MMKQVVLNRMTKPRPKKPGPWDALADLLGKMRGQIDALSCSIAGVEVGATVEMSAEELTKLPLVEVRIGNQTFLLPLKDDKQ